jgi:uncharacterized protein
MFQRNHFQILTNRLLEPRKFIQVLLGPRQVGKTTLITQLLAKRDTAHLFVSADAVPVSNQSWLDQQWQVARLKMDQGSIVEFLLVIDEIQKIGNWSEVVKRNWDRDTRDQRNLKVILLGSSRLLLQMGLTESLAGRFETTYMGHWSFLEMQEAFGWNADQYVWFGGYPGSASLIADEDRWKAYLQQSLIETSISKDILMLTRVDKPALMRQLFELGCLYSGQILSYTKMLGQLQDAGNTTTLSHYLELLDTAGLLAGIQKYSTNTLNKKGSSPKFQVHNTALISAQRQDNFAEVISKPDEWGRMVESAIGAYLINQAAAGGLKLYYWRERNDEVDFVLERKGEILALEVKSGASRDVAGISAFQRLFNPDNVLLIGDTGLPWQEFLKMNPAELF